MFDREFYNGQPKPSQLINYNARAQAFVSAEAVLRASAELRIVRDAESPVVDLQRRVNIVWVVWKQWEA